MKVSFRIEKSGEVVAVFAELYAWYGEELTSYTHNGQHGAISPYYYRNSTKPATPEQYAGLLAELRGQGYDDLQVVRRLPMAEIYRDA